MNIKCDDYHQFIKISQKKCNFGQILPVLALHMSILQRIGQISLYNHRKDLIYEKIKILILMIFK